MFKSPNTVPSIPEALLPIILVAITCVLEILTGELLINPINPPALPSLLFIFEFNILHPDIVEAVFSPASAPKLPLPNNVILSIITFEILALVTLSNKPPGASISSPVITEVYSLVDSVVSIDIFFNVYLFPSK
ncbi:hypothetical protein D3C76_972280 [compost metagenome]